MNQNQKAAGATPSLPELQKLSRELRISILEMLTQARSGHPGGSLSAIDLLTVLWFGEMRGVADPQKLPPHRDRFILSKGHGVPALYAVLERLGYIRTEELKTLRQIGSRLQGHPDRARLPVVEASTGSLGQGMSVAQGLAMGLHKDHPEALVYCLVGDGEIQEGQIWECALSAAKYKLSNLCVILDQNGGQIDGPVSQVMPIEPVKEKWAAFGWHVIDIDGHDFAQIQSAFSEVRSLRAQGSKKPVFIRARTVKGKGVSFMENKIEWHGVAPKPDELTRAIAEIRAQA
jgi:transketolase